MAAILKKDAVYNVFGLSVFELFDEVRITSYLFSALPATDLLIFFSSFRSTSINGSPKF